MGARRDARAALAAAGLRPRKRLGQHFLADPGVVRRIVETAAIPSGGAVLEIGPGLGALTDALAAAAAKLWLVEVDAGLAARLRERYADRPHVVVIEGDVLALPLADLVPDTATVVANLPYNIGTQVIFRLLDLRTRFPRAVVMLQREVADRLAAKPDTSDWGVLSVIVQTWAEVRIAFGVSKRSFVPPPQVASAVVELRWHATPRVDVGDPAAHREVVRAAFGQRRKTLRNALGALSARWGIDGAGLAAACAAAGVDPGVRAETLDVAAFGRLTRALLETRRA